MEDNKEANPTSRVVKFIQKGGAGGEATVDVELRNEFPGLGGTILTRDGVICALREEREAMPKAGHKTFLRHMIVKKLEDYFYRLPDSYAFSHIPRPLGSISKESGSPYEAYIYQWVFGSEGFPWEISDQHGDRKPIQLEDWNTFVSRFNDAGIDVGYDVTDADNGRISKNIIHMFPSNYMVDETLPPIWKRIDFGNRSLDFNFEKLQKFISDNRSRLTEVLRFDRYEMVRLAVQYLIGDKDMNPRDIGQLEVYVGSYRGSSLRHYIKGQFPSDKNPVFEKGRESL